ncbi:hypothetical protein G7054_g13666 [Neopestalotiopsis clavispora]|nr:hypothetical protein G7054_g13666 [Neopestalotiopsis clavispora]
MTSVIDQIRAAAPRNHELLAILSETDHAPPDLHNQRTYLADLNQQLINQGNNIRNLEQKRQKELSEHANYRDSVMRRFAYKVGGKKEKFAARAAQEEREYFDALQEEHRAKEQHKAVQQLRDDALRVRDGLAAEVERREQAQRDLDGLYESIFSGPTPEFPDEDQKEHRGTVAWQAVEEALDHSRMDMFGGGTFTDMMERNALSQAEMAVQDAFWHFRNAQRSDPLIQDLPPLKIAQGNLMSDVFFDNIFTDMAFHDKIKDSRAELQRCIDVLRAQLQGATAKHQELARDQDVKNEALKTARAELQLARKEIFERTVRGHDDAPPSYKEVTA